MKKIAIVALAASSLLLAQGQLPRPVRSQLESALRQAPNQIRSLQLPLPPSYARTAGIFKPDSFWVDFSTNGNWTLGELTTYLYNSDGALQRDSNYVWNSGWEIQDATQYYYYTTGSFSGKDSLQIEFNCSPTCEPNTRRQFSYTSLLSPNSFRANQLDEEWNGTSWDPVARTKSWYRVVSGNPLLDSIIGEAYISGSWTDAFKYYVFYNNQNNPDSVYTEAAGGIFISYAKFFYDAQGRVSLVRDTSAFFSAPYSASLTYFFYDGSSTQPSRDSMVTRDYQTNPPILSIQRRTYTYDANGNVLTVVHDTCRASQPQNCSPTTRERYHYRQFAAAIAPTSSKQPIPSVWPSGATVELPPQIGRTYRLYDGAGRLLQQGSLSESAPTSFTLPTQLGLYILQIDQQAYRLFVLP